MKSTTKKWIATAACIGIAASVFTFQPAMAESFLKMFRVNQIESVAISEKDIQEMQNVFSEGKGNFNLKDLITVDAKNSGNELTLDQPTPEELTAKLPELPLFAQGQYKVNYAAKMPSSDITMTLNVPKVNDVLAGLGETVKMPEALDKKPVVIHFKDTYTIQMSSKEKDSHGYVSFAMSTFPDVEIPNEVDQNAFLKSLYAMNFIPQNLKQQFMSIENPGSAIPVPYSTETQTKETVSVNGKDVMIIKDKKGDNLSLYFMMNDKLCFMNTNAKQEDVISWIKELR